MRWTGLRPGKPLCLNFGLYLGAEEFLKHALIFKAVILAATWQLHGGWGQSAGLGSNEEAGHEAGTSWTRSGRRDIEKG